MPSKISFDDSITQAVSLLKKGGVIVYPTETVYGIGCDPFNREACERIQVVKGRKEMKPMLLLACSRKQVETIIGSLSPIASSLADRFWPGPLTLILKPSKMLPPHLVGLTGGIGFRVSANTLSSELARKLGKPIVSTSANKAGLQPVVTYEEACAVFGDIVDLVLPLAGYLSGVPSTIVDVTCKQPVVLREGGISSEQLSEVFG